MCLCLHTQVSVCCCVSVCKHYGSNEYDYGPVVCQWVVVAVVVVVVKQKTVQSKPVNTILSVLLSL